MKKLLIAIPFLVLGASIVHHKISKKDRKTVAIGNRGDVEYSPV